MILERSDVTLLISVSCQKNDYAREKNQGALVSWTTSVMRSDLFCFASLNILFTIIVCICTSPMWRIVPLRLKRPPKFLKVVCVSVYRQV